MCESKCKITWVNRAYLGLLNNISPKKFKASIHKSFFVISQLSRSIKSKQASQMPQFLNMVHNPLQNYLHPKFSIQYFNSGCKSAS